jgi:hypothetical protein
VARAVGDDEPALGGREVAVGDVDRDALLALGAQAVREPREVERAVAPVKVVELVGEDRLRVVQQSPDQRLKETAANLQTAILTPAREGMALVQGVKAAFAALREIRSAATPAPAVLGGISAPLDSANAFAMAFGGGIDIGLSRHFAIRAAQVDFIRTNFNSVDALTSGLSSGLDNHQNSFRYSGGVVWRF